MLLGQKIGKRTCVFTVWSLLGGSLASRCKLLYLEHFRKTWRSKLLQKLCNLRFYRRVGLIFLPREIIMKILIHLLFYDILGI